MALRGGKSRNVRASTIEIVAQILGVVEREKL